LVQAAPAAASAGATVSSAELDAAKAELEKFRTERNARNQSISAIKATLHDARVHMARLANITQARYVISFEIFYLLKQANKNRQKKSNQTSKQGSHVILDGIFVVGFLF
jgi:hypothetical protein